MATSTGTGKSGQLNIGEGEAAPKKARRRRGGEAAGAETAPPTQKKASRSRRKSASVEELTAQALGVAGRLVALEAAQAAGELPSLAELAEQEAEDAARPAREAAERDAWAELFPGGEASAEEQKAALERARVAAGGDEADDEPEPEASPCELCGCEPCEPSCPCAGITDRRVAGIVVVPLQRDAHVRAAEERTAREYDRLNGRAEVARAVVEGAWPAEPDDAEEVRAVASPELPERSGEAGARFTARGRRAAAVRAGEPSLLVGIGEGDAVDREDAAEESRVLARALLVTNLRLRRVTGYAATWKASARRQWRSLRSALGMVEAERAELVRVRQRVCDLELDYEIVCTNVASDLREARREASARAHDESREAVREAREERDEARRLLERGWKLTVSKLQSERDEAHRERDEAREQTRHTEQALVDAEEDVGAQIAAAEVRERALRQAEFELARLASADDVSRQIAGARRDLLGGLPRYTVEGALVTDGTERDEARRELDEARGAIRSGSRALAEADAKIVRLTEEAAEEAHAASVHYQCLKLDVERMRASVEWAAGVRVVEYARGSDDCLLCSVDQAGRHERHCELGEAFGYQPTEEEPAELYLASIRAREARVTGIGRSYVDPMDGPGRMARFAELRAARGTGTACATRFPCETKDGSRLRGTTSSPRGRASAGRVPEAQGGRVRATADGGAEGAAGEPSDVQRSHGESTASAEHPAPFRAAVSPLASEPVLREHGGVPGVFRSSRVTNEDSHAGADSGSVSAASEQNKTSSAKRVPAGPRESTRAGGWERVADGLEGVLLLPVSVAARAAVVRALGDADLLDVAARALAGAGGLGCATCGWTGDGGEARCPMCRSPFGGGAS